MGKRILIVDDDIAFVSAARRAIKAAGHEPLIASSGADAEAVVVHGGIDLVLLSLGPSIGDPEELTSALRERGDSPLLTVLFIGDGEGEITNNATALAVGADAYLEKPIDWSKLISSLPAYLGEDVEDEAAHPGDATDEVSTQVTRSPFDELPFDGMPEDSGSMEASDSVPVTEPTFEEDSEQGSDAEDAEEDSEEGDSPEQVSSEGPGEEEVGEEDSPHAGLAEEDLFGDIGGISDEDDDEDDGGNEAASEDAEPALEDDVDALAREMASEQDLSPPEEQALVKPALETGFLDSEEETSEPGAKSEAAESSTQVDSPVPAEPVQREDESGAEAFFESPEDDEIETGALPIDEEGLSSDPVDGPAEDEEANTEPDERDWGRAELPADWRAVKPTQKAKSRLGSGWSGELPSAIDLDPLPEETEAKSSRLPVVPDIGSEPPRPRAEGEEQVAQHQPAGEVATAEWGPTIEVGASTVEGSKPAVVSAAGAEAALAAKPLETSLSDRGDFEQADGGVGGSEGWPSDEEGFDSSPPVAGASAEGQMPEAWAGEEGWSEETAEQDFSASSDGFDETDFGDLMDEEEQEEPPPEISAGLLDDGAEEYDPTAAPRATEERQAEEDAAQQAAALESPTSDSFEPVYEPPAPPAVPESVVAHAEPPPLQAPTPPAPPEPAYTPPEPMAPPAPAVVQAAPSAPPPPAPPEPAYTPPEPMAPPAPAVVQAAPPAPPPPAPPEPAYTPPEPMAPPAPAVVQAAPPPQPPPSTSAPASSAPSQEARPIPTLAPPWPPPPPVEQPPQPAIDPAPQAGPPPFDVEGDLVAMDAPALLSEAWRARATGLLEVQGPTGVRHLFLELGRPVAALSAFYDEQLPEVALRLGRVLKEQADEVRRSGPSAPRRQAISLVEAGALKAQELFDTVRAQAQAVLFGAFTVEEGRWLWREQRCPEDLRVALPDHPFALITEGIRRKMSLARVHRRLGGPATLLELSQAPELHLLGLAARERRMAEQVDGLKTAEELVFISGIGEEATYQVLYSLAATGQAVVRFRGPMPEGRAFTPEERRAEVDIDRGRIEDKFRQALESDYFEILGVGLDATSYEIRAAHERLSRIFHPGRYAAEEYRDLWGKIEEIRRGIDDAHDVLKDEGLRADYLEAIKSRR